MEEMSRDARINARIQLVEKHVRLGNLHDLDGILDTFGPDARYDDEPWDDHRIGRDQVHLYYKQMLAAAADFRIEVRNWHATGEAVILEVTISGTHTGGLAGHGEKSQFSSVRAAFRISAASSGGMSLASASALSIS
jgi:SnoaL-like domain